LPLSRNFRFSSQPDTIYPLGTPAHKYFLWPGPGLRTRFRLAQFESHNADHGLSIRSCQTPLRPLLTLDRFLGHRWKKVLERHPELSGWDKTVANYRIPLTTFPPVRSKSQMSPDTYERLGLIQRRYPADYKSSAALTDSGYKPIYQSEVVFQFVFTGYADEFLRACQGPRAAAVGSDSTTPKLGH
jgi:hypothetical protein